MSHFTTSKSVRMLHQIRKVKRHKTNDGRALNVRFVKDKLSVLYVSCRPIFFLNISVTFKTGFTGKIGSINHRDIMVGYDFVNQL